MQSEDETERQRLEAELMKAGHDLGMPDPRSIAIRNGRIAELQEQLRALPPRPPLPAAAPRSVIIDGRLGSDFVRPHLAPEGARALTDYNPWGFDNDE